MAKGINIDFVANVSKFIGGTKDIEGALDDVIDSLDDVGRDADKSSDKAVRSFDKIEDAAKDAGKAVDKQFADKVDDAGDEAKTLEKKFRDSFDGVKKESKTSGQSIGDDAKKGFGEASEATETFKNEARQNLSETVSSFRGDTEDLAQIAQDVLGGVVSDLGPLGMAAGTAAAAGIGIAVAKLQDMAEKINAAKEEAGALALEFKDAGGRIEELDLIGKFDEWLVAIEDSRQWFEVWQDDAITNLDNVRVALDDTGISLGDLYNAFSEGDTSTLEDYVEKLKDVNRELVPDGHQANTKAQNEEFQARKNTITGLEDEIKKRKDAEDMAYQMRAAEEGVTEETLRQRDAMEGRNDALQESIDLNKEVIDGELDWLDTLDETTAKLAENAAAGWDKNTAAGRENLRALGEISEGALGYADSITEAGGSQAEANAIIEQGREKVIAAGIALGMSEQDAKDYATSLGLIPKEVSTTAKANTTQAEQDLAQVARQREVELIPVYQQSQFQWAADMAARGVVPPKINIHAQLGISRPV
ncbi:hypothetical protein ACFWGN_20690 [Oerskovia sp. NPDC060338]|uniref:hypothetical protein n=1 Tax=Oerskovia sp. NPDC060338 TaxID=3347100 RepID=UPI0036537286